MQPTENKPEQQGAEEHVISEYYEGVKQLELEGYETGIRKARNALFATCVLVFIGEFISAGSAGIGITPELIGIALVEAGIFVALGFWTKKKPYSAIIVGLVLFLLMWVGSVLINGTKGIYSGIIIKIVIIVYLVKALKDARAWEQTKKTM